jgi:type III pantothenate kinase
MGAFQGADLAATWRMSTDARRTPDEYAALLLELLRMRELAPATIEAAAICSVVPPLTGVFEDALSSVFHVDSLVVREGTKTGLRILYESPRDVGADRIVAASAAYHLHGAPAIIVEFGTATVFDAVTRDGEYLGGAIHPGLQVAAEALFTTTSQLRRVELHRPAAAIGRNTVEAIQSGVVFGHVGLAEGMVRRFRQELGADARVIATGGLARIVARESDLLAVVDEDLILQGLRVIHGMNQP